MLRVFLSAPILLLATVFFESGSAFSLDPAKLKGDTFYDTFASRRCFVQQTSGLLGVASLAWSGTPSVASASGGATAGGAYLLSAKQRYNKRVTSGVSRFLALTPDTDSLRPFFEDEDEGSWADLSAAGYLLSNAFRSSSTKAPDALPSVKKWKKFSKNVELLKKAMSKKDKDKMKAAYAVALDSLDAYLEGVELPSSEELKQL